METNLKEMLLEKAIDIVTDGCIERAKKGLEKHKTETELDAFYTSVFDQISSAIPDEWELSKVEHYIAKCTPIQLDPYSSLFDHEMRKNFINRFYEVSQISYRSTAIDRCLNQYLNNLETHLGLSIENKFIFSKLNRMEALIQKAVECVPHERDENTVSLLIHHSRIRIKYFLKYYLSSKLKMYAAVDEPAYEDLIENINRTFQFTWKSDLLGLLHNGCKKKSQDYAEQMDFIRSNQELDVILETAKDIISEGTWDKEAKTNLKEMIRHRQYSKVCLVAGEMGTGKSFFLRKFIEQAIDAGQFIILPVNAEDFNRSDSIDTVLLKAFNIALNMECDSLADLINRAKLLELRLVAVIDDIQDIYLSNKKLFVDLLNSIKYLSKYDELSWMITVNTYEYFALESSPDFINCYCFGHNDSNMTFLRNAINLDQYNYQNSVVSKILSKYHVAMLSTDQQNEANVGTVFETPLYAHIFGQCCEGQQAVAYPESHFAYIDTISKMFAKRLGDSALGSSSYETMMHIVQLIHQLKRTELSGREMIDLEITSLNQFIMCHLLSTTEKRTDDMFDMSFGFSETTYQLRVEIFWAYTYVRYLNSIAEPTTEILKHIQQFPMHFQDSLAPCYMRYADAKENDRIATVVATFFEQGLGFYPLFCAKNASKSFRNAVADYLLKYKLEANLKTSYALLYFIYHNRFPVEKKLAILCKYATDIDTSGLFDLYSIVLQKTVSLITTESGLKRKMGELVHCQAADINYHSGNICANRYLELCRHSQHDIINSLHNIVNLALENTDIQNSVRIEIGQNSSFMDFFLRRCFEQAFRTTEFNTIYCYFRDRRFFTIRAPIGIYLLRNFTCAAGNTYASRLGKSGFCEQYVALISELSESTNPYDRKTAMFLIENSIREVDRLLSLELIPHFLLLWEDPDIRSQFGSHKQVHWILRQLESAED